MYFRVWTVKCAYSMPTQWVPISAQAHPANTTCNIHTAFSLSFNFLKFILRALRLLSDTFTFWTRRALSFQAKAGTLEKTWCKPSIFLEIPLYEKNIQVYDIYIYIILYFQKILKCLNCNLAIAGNRKELFYFTEHINFCGYSRNPFGKKGKVRIAKIAISTLYFNIDAHPYLSVGLGNLPFSTQNTCHDCALYVNMFLKLRSYTNIFIKAMIAKISMIRIMKKKPYHLYLQ